MSVNLGIPFLHFHCLESDIEKAWSRESGLHIELALEAEPEGVLASRSGLP